MALLLLGVLVWTAVHLIPSLAIPLRTRVIESIGEQAYQGIFALSLIASIVAMVLGWQSATWSLVFLAPPWTTHATHLLVFVGLVLFIASRVKSDLNRHIRHPQLIGMTLWAGGHLISNGELRSLILFGALLLWAVAEIVLINRRDGEWRKPEAKPPASVLKPVGAAAVVFVVLFLLHPYMTGVSAMPR